MQNGKPGLKKGHKSSNSLSKKGQSSFPIVHRSSVTSISDRISTQTSDLSLSEKLQPCSSIRDQCLKKPISLIILGKYFSDLCSSISSKNSIDSSLLKKVETMKEVLKDCLSAIPDIKLEAYVLMSSSLKEIQNIKDTKDESNLNSLTKKLANIAVIIDQNRLRNRVERSPQLEDDLPADEPEDLSKELEVRVSRVTARVLNIWKKIVSPQKEAEVICYCFLMLYSEIDRSIKVSPVIKSNFDKPTDIMKSYLNNPGYVVTIIRHTKDYIDKELISVPVIKRIFGFLEKVTIERIRNSDKTLTGFVIYELVFYAVMYYSFIYKQKHGNDLFEKKINWKKVRSQKNFINIYSENSLTVTEADVFDEFVVEEVKKVKVAYVDKMKRSSSQPAIKGFRNASPDKLKKTGLFVLKEKMNKKKQKMEKDKEFVNNLKIKFSNLQIKNNEMMKSCDLTGISRNLNDRYESVSPRTKEN